MSDLERWRQLFREEAQRCVKELREVIEQDGRGIPGERGDTRGIDPQLGFGEELLLQLEAQRKTDQAETESLRSHVEELLRLNSSLRQAALDQSSSKEFTKLRGCVVDLTKEVQSLMGTKRQEHPIELAKVAADAASRAFKQNREEVVRLLHSNLEAQQKVFEGRWKSEDERWTTLDREVTSLRQQTKLLEEMSGQLWEEVGEQLVEKMATRLDTMLEEKLKSFSRTGGEAAQQRATSKAAARSAAEEATERFMAGIEPRFDLVLQEMKRGTGVEAGCQKALEKPMADLEETVRTCVKEAVGTEAEMRRLQVEALEAKSEVSRYQQELEQMRHKFNTEASQSRLLQLKLKDAEAELQDAKSSIEEANQTAGLRFLQQVKLIQGRGNVTLDIAKCVLEIKKGMDFKAKKPTEAPVAQFTDESLATSALADASELVAMLKGAKVTVESHVKPAGKGQDAFWEQVAENRANLIREHLAAKTSDEDGEIVAKGLHGPKSNNQVVVKIDVT